jgi:nicotinate phosphoribosyltransferase
MTNDFRGLIPNEALDPFSLVCKAVVADGKETVKLSDNPNKALGPKKEIDRYKKIFGNGDQLKIDLVV